MAAKIGRAAVAATRLAQAITTEPTSLPPPLKGWNARDPYEAMDAQDAVTLDNFYPDYAGTVSRDGSQVYAVTDAVNPVPTLAVWRQGDQSAMIAATKGQLWNVSNPQTGSAVVGEGPYQSDWWATVNYHGYLFLFNGRDPPQQWQGPAGPAVTTTGFSLDPAAGFDPSYINALSGASVRHNRLYFWTGRDAGFWYTDVVDGIAGLLRYFPFSQVVPDGAACIGIDVLTYDGGTGIADYTIFILSTGEILSYEGTDPSNPDNWSLVGLYTIAAPVGGAEVSGDQTYPNRAYFRYGGDIYITTSSDHTKLSQLIIALKLGQMPPRSKVSMAVMDAVAASKNLPGWQIVYWGYKRRLIFNIPQVDGSFQQHVYNPALDAWCRYKGLPAMCWCVWGDRLFFGTPRGMVVEHGVNGTDQLYLMGSPWNTSPWGSPWTQVEEMPIMVSGQQAWNLFGTPLEKRVVALRSVVQSLGVATYFLTLGFDYHQPSIVIEINQEAIHTPWDTSPWGSPWSAEVNVDSQWQIAGGDGSAISVMVSGMSYQQLIWVRTDLRLERGRAL